MRTIFFMTIFLLVILFGNSLASRVVMTDRLRNLLSKRSAQLKGLRQVIDSVRNVAKKNWLHNEEGVFFATVGVLKATAFWGR
jgi:hypothetical protein